MALTIADYRKAFDMMPSPALILDGNLIIVACNAAYERLVKINRLMMVGRTLFDVYPASGERQDDSIGNSIDQVMKSVEVRHMPHLQYAIDAIEERAVENPSWTAKNIPICASDGTVRFVLHCPTDSTGFMPPRDVSRLAGAANADIANSSQNTRTDPSNEHKRLQQLFQQAPGFFCVLQGPRHVFELANDAYYQLVGHRDVIGQAAAAVLPELAPQGFFEKLDRVYATSERFVGRAVPILLQRIAGGAMEQRYIDMIYEPMLDAEGTVTGIFVQGHDVTEAHVLAQEISFQAAHDPLTGMFNRREFERQTRKIDGAGPHALLYMDIDHFKIINDRCGHRAGDALLLQVAEALKSRCGTDQDLLARLGGDEFALLRRDCTQEAAFDLAEDLRQAIGSIIFIWDGKRHGVTLSIGLASFGEAESGFFDSVLCLADAACFLAKEKGRNRVQVSLRDDAEVRQQQHDMDTVSRLKDAIREDRVVLFGQKIIGLHPKSETGEGLYEVLARLRDYDGAIVPPSSFIPAAERFGLINELDRHIVRKIFSHIQAQRSADRPDTSYFINLSGITLSAPGFVDFIAKTIADFPSVSTSRICFEITETAAISNVHRTADCMHRLIAMGISFALDDFGSGMASFNYLKLLPVQYIKIDGEIIRRIATQPANAIIVAALAKIARTMNMQTIAESVEVDELIPQLRSLGLDYGQGYAIHRPEPL